MKKKISLFMLCGVILLGLCGCGKVNIEDEIAGKTFINKEEMEPSAYGSSIAVIEFSFIGNGKGEEKVSIEFTGEFKDYVDKLNIEPTTYDLTYTIDEDIINVIAGKDEYKLKYDKDSKCLIDTEKETRKFCQ